MEFAQDVGAARSIGSHEEVARIVAEPEVGGEGVKAFAGGAKRIPCSCPRLSGVFDGERATEVNERRGQLGDAFGEDLDIGAGEHFVGSL